LSGKSDFEKAIAAYKEAIRLQPDYALAHISLGNVTRQMKEIMAQAQADRGAPAHLRRLEPKLPLILKGEVRPADAAETLAAAELCRRAKLWAPAARFYADAFAADPKLAGDMEAGLRNYAARCAALACCGQSKDTDKLSDEECARWRKQALAWLRADLEHYAQQLESGKLRDRSQVQQRLQRWQRDPDLAGLRDPAAVAKLPAEEQEACKQLWTDVEALLKRAHGKE
jgi:serine/threonine-protein kinase